MQTLVTSQRALSPTLEKKCFCYVGTLEYRKLNSAPWLVYFTKLKTEFPPKFHTIGATDGCYI